MFRNDDDAATIQLSDANSTLGNLLLDADWDGCLEYLATPEGRHDARAGRDPLGLGGDGGRGGDEEDSSSFAALFVRAPIAILGAILDASPPMSRVGLPEGSFSSPLLERRPCPPRRPRGNGASSSSSSSSSGVPSLLLTPLAIAAYNPDVPPSIVRLLCSLEPRAMNAGCQFPRGGGGGAVETTPLFLAAASPLPPPESSPEYGGLRERRWEKVVLLTLSREWHEGQRGLLFSGAGEDDDVLASPPREPTSAEVRRACEEAMRMDEWELVREYARRYPPSSPGGDDDAAAREALARHDERETASAERREREGGKRRARGEWLRRNMGPVMYEIDALWDLVSAMIPASRKKKCRDGTAGRRGIVMRMS